MHHAPSRTWRFCIMQVHMMHYASCIRHHAPCLHPACIIHASCSMQAAPSMTRCIVRHTSCVVRCSLCILRHPPCISHGVSMRPARALWAKRHWACRHVESTGVGFPSLRFLMLLLGWSVAQSSHKSSASPQDFQTYFCPIQIQTILLVVACGCLRVQNSLMLEGFGSEHELFWPVRPPGTSLSDQFALRSWLNFHWHYIFYQNDERDYILTFVWLFLLSRYFAM